MRLYRWCLSAKVNDRLLVRKRVQCSYSAATADPSTPLLRSSGRDDKGRAVTHFEDEAWDGQTLHSRRQQRPDA
jgi:hypothetical protein